jgi:hypothetical protein
MACDRSDKSDIGLHALVAYVAFLSLQYPFYWNAVINGFDSENVQPRLQLRTYFCPMTSIHIYETFGIVRKTRTLPRNRARW